MSERIGPLFAPLFALLCSALLVGICADDNGVVVAPLLDVVVQPPFEFLGVPLVRSNGIKVQGRAGGTCSQNGKTYNDQEEWAHYTTAQTVNPYYGFKLKCQDGTVQVLGQSPNKTNISADRYQISYRYHIDTDSIGNGLIL